MNRRRAIAFLILSLVLASALAAPSVPYTATAAPGDGPSAQVAPAGATGVIVSGEIERIAIATRTDHWSGGTIQVGGHTVIVPRNLLVDLPANRLTLKEIYDQAPAACLTTGETGLAKGDVCNLTGAGGFATIHANTTAAGNVIAGYVFIEKGVEAVIGEVTYINYAEGYFRLSGDPAAPTTTGVMVRLNDPDGRHTVQQGAGCAAGSPNCSPDPRFTLDPDNYTNAFHTGYPICIPSTVSRTFVDVLGLGVTTAQAAADGSGDVLCPLTNRPATGPVADSRRFAPIKLGDTITAEGSLESVNGVQFLSAHTTMVLAALATSQLPGQPDYMFLDEVEIDMPAFQNERIRTLIIGYTTFTPADVLIWSLHYDPGTNTAHELPLATTQGCETAAGAGNCANLTFVPGAGDIFRIRHDLDFLVGAKARLNPCAHLAADPRMGTGFCPNGGATEGTTAPVLADQLGILSPIPHEIQARTGRKLASLQPGGTPLLTIDIRGNEATNGQYLFPFGMGLGGLASVEPNEFNLNAANMPFYFSGLPWALDRRLSPAGCLDTNGDGTADCEGAPQPLDPFPFEGQNPRTQAAIPSSAYNDPNFTASPLSDSRNRLLSFVSPTLGKFGGDTTLLAWPPADPALLPITPALPVILAVTQAVPPVANAGADRMVPMATTVTLDGRGSTGTITGYSWTQTGGTSLVTLTGASTSVATFTSPSVADTLTFTLTTTGPGGPPTSDTVVVTVLNPPPGANAGADQTVPAGATVTLDGRASTGAITAYSWAQTAGTPLVALTGANSSVATFTAPTVAGAVASLLTFTLTTTGPGGPATTDAVNIAVLPPAPVANAGINQTVAQGKLGVILDGSATTGAATYSWRQTAGTPAVALTGAGTATATFDFPDQFADLTFELTATNPGGSSTATVQVTAIPDVLSVVKAEYRTATRLWLVTGTTTMPGPTTITVHAGTSLAGPVVGTATVDNQGFWSLSVEGSAVPPDASGTISVVSSRGGQVLAFPAPAL